MWWGIIPHHIYIFILIQPIIFIFERIVYIMTIQEASALLTPEALDHLRDVTCPWEINIDKKDCDIVMSSLCKAVTDNVIKKTSLDENTVTILNSDTATLTAGKLEAILKTVSKSQNIVCLIKLRHEDNHVAFVYTPTGNDLSFNPIFEYVIKECEVTSVGIRHNLEGKYKASVINNIAQLLRKHEVTPDEPISIKHITRIFTAYKGIIICKFCDAIDVRDETQGYTEIVFF